MNPKLFFIQCLPLIQISSSPINLQLKRAFNTAHSSSLSRTNFLIKVSCKWQQNKDNNSIDIIGYGQCGLPPKKPFCYLSDTQDCKMFISDLNKMFEKQRSNILQQIQKIKEQNKIFKLPLIQLFYEVFNDIININQNNQIQNNLSFFSLLQNKILLCKFQLIFNKLDLQDQQNKIHYLNSFLLYQILIIFKQAKLLHKQKKQYSACRSALQFALFDYLGKLYKISVADIIYQGQNKNTQQIQQNYSFYTISYQKEIQQMVKNGKESLIYTHYIKIKFNNDIKQLIKLLIRLNQQEIGKKWIIDANASWSPQQYQLFQNQINHLPIKLVLKQKILFIEQPFPIFQALKGSFIDTYIDQLKKKWSSIRQSTQFKIIADQSFVQVSNLQDLKFYCHGINIKMQKCGGPLQGTKILKQFPKYNNFFSQLMFGSMVSTHLGCSQTFQFNKFAKYFDIDGALLTASPQIRGGFEWKGEQGIKILYGNGLSMVDSDIEILF